MWQLHNQELQFSDSQKLQQLKKVDAQFCTNDSHTAIKVISHAHTVSETILLAY